MSRPRRVVAVVSAIVFAVVGTMSVIAAPVWQSGTLLKIEKKVESTPRTYVWDVVVTSTDVTTYRLHIRVDGRTYVTDYSPEIQPSSLPSGWEEGRLLKVRVEKQQMFIRTSYGEVTTYIRRGKQ